MCVWWGGGGVHLTCVCIHIYSTFIVCVCVQEEASPAVRTRGWSLGREG